MSWRGRATLHYMPDDARGIAYPLYVRVQRELALRGITTVELREKTGVARSTITNWRHVEQTPQPRTVNKVADYLGIPREEALRLAGILTDEDVPVPSFVRRAVRAYVAETERGEQQSRGA